MSLPLTAARYARCNRAPSVSFPVRNSAPSISHTGVTSAETLRIVVALMREGRYRRAYLGIAGGSRPLPPRKRRSHE